MRTSWLAVVCLSAVEGRGEAVYRVCKDGLERVMLEATQNPMWADAFAKLRRGSKGRLGSCRKWGAHSQFIYGSPSCL